MRVRSRVHARSVGVGSVSVVAVAALAGQLAMAISCSSNDTNGAGVTSAATSGAAGDRMSGAAGSATGGAAGSGAGGASSGGGGAGPAGSGGAEMGGAAGLATGGSAGSSDGGADAASPMGDAGEAGPSDGGASDVRRNFALTSSAFQEGMVIPVVHKCTGQNLSPPLSWTAGPAGTLSYAMTLIHNAPDMSIHWVLWDIPAGVTSLPMNVAKVAEPPDPAGSKQMRPNVDGSTWFGYQGPCPQGAGTQSYQFAVYALDVATLPGVTTASSSMAAMNAVRMHQIGRATLSGTQTR